ncbi:hypothetical protein KM472_gp154 [Cynomolgus macaque cytomegalovirus strain Ottawa]|uniref:Uncharacterized protein n=2 Tax=Cytomegalovirus TaxID=10358 RepID=G8H0N3_9BETA|nr:hypothetical protein KM472_gp154 [Cynomolgus macaque cytomegalovirus strain Ottawa]AEQ32231.1 hypothetical protein cy148_ex3 [Cynomolgus macaque cytomegalovirus strain Ottawa]AKT72927.1 hypothetical protein [Cynomolgus macaque cytomegalovirus strain Mauritius]AXG21851.1 hypothetical protein [synthetic construct]AXG22119.1 hypothetical protein [synthetic construct]
MSLSWQPALACTGKTPAWMYFLEVEHKVS